MPENIVIHSAYFKSPRQVRKRRAGIHVSLINLLSWQQRNGMALGESLGTERGLMRPVVADVSVVLGGSVTP